MKFKKVFVLIHSNVDYTNVEVYEKKKDAIEALKELAEEYGMDVIGNEASGDGEHATVEDKTMW
jgi:hypothetical protein